MGNPKMDKHPGGRGGGVGGSNTATCLIIRRVKPPPLVTEVLLQGGRVTLAAETKLSVVAFTSIFFVR